MDNELDTVTRFYNEVRDFFPEGVEAQEPKEFILGDGSTIISATIKDRYSSFAIIWTTQWEPDVD